MDNTDRTRLNGAVRLLREGKRVRGSRLLSELTDRYRTSPRALMQIGDAWLRAEEKAHAVSVFQLAGERYLEQQFHKHASAMFRNVLELEPEHLLARKLLIEALTHQGMHAEAQTVRTRAGFLRPKTREVDNAPRSPKPSRPLVRAVYAFALGGLFALGPLGLQESGWLTFEGKSVTVHKERLTKVVTPLLDDARALLN